MGGTRLWVCCQNKEVVVFTQHQDGVNPPDQRVLRCDFLSSYVPAKAGVEEPGNKAFLRLYLWTENPGSISTCKEKYGCVKLLSFSPTPALLQPLHCLHKARQEANFLIR